MRTLLTIALMCLSIVAFAGDTEQKKQEIAEQLKKNAEELKQAEEGNALAQYTVGVAYYGGYRGFPKDGKEAVKWYLKSAAQGNVKAQGALGVMYSGGNGVPKDLKEAMKWRLKAAEQGDASAQFSLGSMYRDGEGSPQDFAQAYMWLWVATQCKGGFPRAAEELKALEKGLTPVQLKEGQRLTTDWMATHPQKK